MRLTSDVFDFLAMGTALWCHRLSREENLDRLSPGFGQPRPELVLAATRKHLNLKFYVCMYVCMYGNALCGVVCPAPLRTSHVCLTPKLTVVDQRGLITNP